MHGRIPPEIVGGVVAGAVVLLFLMIVYRILLRICKPNEILIFSGRTHRTPDGGTVGYRVVFGGRGVRVPVVEQISRMDVSLIAVPIAVQGAYSDGGIPLNVHAIANIKVSTNQRFVGNAIERFLGKDRNEIARVAKETLEGHLRGVLATMTPEALNEDRLQFSKHLEQSAGPDLEKLGLELDVLRSSTSPTTATTSRASAASASPRSCVRRRSPSPMRRAKPSKPRPRHAPAAKSLRRTRKPRCSASKTSCARSKPKSTPTRTPRSTAPKLRANRRAPRPSSSSRKFAASSSKSGCKPT